MSRSHIYAYFSGPLRKWGSETQIICESQHVFDGCPSGLSRSHTILTYSVINTSHTREVDLNNMEALNVEILNGRREMWSYLPITV